MREWQEKLFTQSQVCGNQVTKLYDSSVVNYRLKLCKSILYIEHELSSVDTIKANYYYKS